MPDMRKLKENKERIISLIKTSGPSFPTRLSRSIEMSPLFISAFLSELVSEKRLKMSNMKVGGSPLYFTEGQEPELEKFTEYLNQREKEAFFLLKEKQVLEDEKQHPAVRVALRGIKDFAIPINVKIDGQPKVLWKFFLLPYEEIEAKLQESLVGKKQKKPEPEKQEVKEVKPELNESSGGVETKEKAKKSRKQKKPESTEFPDSVKDYFSKKDVEFISELVGKKREFNSKIRVDTIFGKQQYFLIARDKKKVTIDDLTQALQKSQVEKMPVLIASPGELDKKAESYLKEWENLIKFEKIK